MIGESVQDRRRPVRAFWILAAALALSAPSGPALAQTPSSEIEAAKKIAAETANQALEAFEAGEYEDAIAGFEKADRAFHAPKFLLYVARAQQKLGRLLAARATYEKILKEKLAPYAPPEFFDAQADAKKELAELTDRIQSEPPAPAPSATAAASASDGPAPGPERPAPQGVPTVTYVAYGAGAVGLVVGVLFGGLTLAKKGEFDANPTAEAADQGEAFSHVADVGFGLAIAGAAVGTVVWVVSARSTKATPQAAKLFVAPRAGGLTIGGTF